MITFVPAAASQPAIVAAPECEGVFTEVGGSATIALTSRLLDITKAEAP